MIDIGSLTGQIALEDQVTDKLTEVIAHVREFGKDLEGALGSVVVGVGAVMAAVTGAVISITALGEEGSKIIGVTNAFDTLAQKAGTTGDILRSSLSEGVKGTVTEMTLMESTSRLLGSGMKLTADQATLMGEAARELGKATGSDAAGGLSILSSALTTGRVRGLQQQIGLIDLAAGEQKFADSIGVSVKALNEAGKLEGKRIAILDATKAYVDRLGVSELSFAERITQVRVSITEWGESLAKSVASSPHVLAAMDAIQAAIQKAFGGTSQMALDTIVNWIDRFADAAARYGPMIIQTIVDIWHGVQDTWQEVQKAWDLVPDWFKNIARDAGLAAVMVGTVTAATGGMTASDVLSGLSNIAQIWSVIGTNITSAMTAIKEFGVASLIVFRTGGLSALVGELGIAVSALGTTFLGLAATPFGFGAALTVLGAAVYQTGKAFVELYQTWKEGKSMWDFFFSQDKDNFVRRWLGLSASVDTVKKSTDIALPSLSDYEKNLTQAGVAVGDVTNGQMGFQTALDKSKFTTDKLTDAEKKLKAAVEAYTNSTAKDWQTVMEKIGATMYEGIAVDLKRGRSVEELALVYGTTKGVIESVQMAEKKYTDAGKVALELWKAEKENLFGLKENILNVDNAELRWLDTQNKHTAVLKTITDLERQAGSGMYSLAGGLENVGQKSFELDDVNRRLEEIDKTLSGRLKSVLGDLPGLLTQAFTGGGGILGALKALGVQLADAILQPVLKGLDAAKQKAIGLGSTIAAGVGGAVGGSGGALVGGLAATAGGLIAQSAGLAVGSVALAATTAGIGLAAVAVYKLWSNWKAHKAMVEANTKAINSFTDTVFAMATKSQLAEANNQRWALTLIEVRDAYLKTGRTAAQAEADVKAMWDAAAKGPAATQAAIDKINQAFIEEKQQAEAFVAAMSDFQQNGASNFNAIALALEGDSASLAGLGAMAMTTYATLIAGGMSSSAALAAIQPGLDSLVKSYEDLGININDAGLASLLMQANIAKGNPALITGIDALASSMSTMEKLGLMNATSFGQMEIAGTSMYAKLQAAAFAAGGSTADALLPMQGYLHQAADEAVKLGIPLDDNTQLLIDQSIELGIWKDQGKSATDTMIDSMNKLVDSVQSLVDVMNSIPRDLTITTHHVDVSDGQAAAGHAGGGVIYAAQGANILPFTPRGSDTVAAMLTPGERVLTVSQNQQYTNREPQQNQAELIAEMRAARVDAARREVLAERRLARIVRDETQKIVRAR